ncbi:MAG: imidazole glycerol phosphate synthase subunit HisH [Candidatus Omnitrophica bacterium]|nr:imidazole glycerol phosphate synthase subunit HisH [Candidatus Omnitrophota bacterium]
MIGIIDYGAGNLRSVHNAFRYIGEEVIICADRASMKDVDKLVFPGVGSGKDAMEGLAKRGLTGAIKDYLGDGRPFLGICLGLQLLFTRSEESGGCEGLGVVEGNVRLFPRAEGLKVPQIGWNTVNILKEGCPLFKGVRSGSYFYFVHSYYCDSTEKESTCGITEYGLEYTSALWKDNIYAVQFHPERSQSNGLKILENFSRL